MESFDLEGLVQDPTRGLQNADKFRKSDWLAIAQRYSIHVPSGLRKEEIRNCVLAGLREAGHISDVPEEVNPRNSVQQATDEVTPGQPGYPQGSMIPGAQFQPLAIPSDPSWQEFELRKLEMMHLEREREREHELRVLALRNESRAQSPRDHAVPHLYKAKGMLPKFSEDDPEGFFETFEDAAEIAAWPQGHWAIMVRSVLTGKAASVVAAIEKEERGNYERVKEEVLRVYEVTPEFYRDKFRSARKGNSQKYLEYAQTLRKTHGKWWKAAEVETLKQATEVTLLEQFMAGIEPRVRTYLCERRVRSLDEAAKLAEDYEIQNKPNYSVLPNRGSGRYEGNGRSYGVAKTRCYLCHGTDHSAGSCPKAAEKKAGTAPPRPYKPRCYHCGKEGHMSPSCPEKKDKGQSWRTKAAMCAIVQRQEEKELREACLFSSPSKQGSAFEGYEVSGVLKSVDGAGEVPVVVLRDTAATQTLVRQAAVPDEVMRCAGPKMIVKGLGGITVSREAKVRLRIAGEERLIRVGVTRDLPVAGVDILLGNDVGGGKIKSFWKDKVSEEVERGHEVVAAVTTRSQARLEEAESRREEEEAWEGLVNLFAGRAAPLADNGAVQRTEMAAEARPGGARRSAQPSEVGERAEGGASACHDQREAEEPPGASEGKGQRQEALSTVSLPATRGELVEEQARAAELDEMRLDALSPQEAEREASCFLTEDGLLLKKSRDPMQEADDTADSYQVVLPRRYRQEVVRLAHEDVTAHLGVTKTGDVLKTYFFWPGMLTDVRKYIKRCNICQVAQGTAPKPVPMQQFPIVEEPFSIIVVDIVGPLPRTRNGNQYLLTIMCRATRYPEAIPMSSCSSKKLLPRLMDVFSKFGVPRVVQSDQGSNFMGKLFQQAVNELGVKHIHSSPYYPQSQGCLERFYRSLKSVLTKFSLENEKDWDEGVQVALYALRTVRHASLGVSSFELMFGRRPREALRVIYEKIMGNPQPENLADYIRKLRSRMECARRLARENMEESQDKMKERYDVKTQDRSFNVGDLVLMFNAGGTRPLQARYQGPYEVIGRSGPCNYVLSTPGRRKQCARVHVNLLKLYEGGEVVAVAYTGVDGTVPTEPCSQGRDDFVLDRADAKLENGAMLRDLKSGLAHLSDEQAGEVEGLLRSFPETMSDVPTQTPLLQHDVILTAGATPIKQHPYRLSPEKRKIMREEVQYLIENGFAVPSQSPWASPCLLVPKAGGDYRLCTDYRKLNGVTVADSYPLPRIEDLIDEVSGATFLTKLDLLKGFYQVPLTEEASQASSFVTPDGLYRYTVMPFGMRNSGSTFQRLANWVIRDLPDVHAYIDDIVVASKSWAQHLESLTAVFKRLSEANLTVNLKKCDFAASTLTYLGHQVGKGAVRPLDAKVKDIVDFPAPASRRSLRRFLGMASYYRRFIADFASISAPLTSMLSTKTKFSWSQDCQESFDALKARLASTPVLCAPDYNKEFVLCVDASDVGTGGVLCQESENILKPVAYMSRKLNQHQRVYSVIEKEALAVIQCLEKFAPYLEKHTVVYSDHNPLKFVETMKAKNARLARWALILQGKDLEIRHVPGRLNISADTLSRPD